MQILIPDRQNLERRSAILWLTKFGQCLCHGFLEIFHGRCRENDNIVAVERVCGMRMVESRRGPAYGYERVPR